MVATLFTEDEIKSIRNEYNFKDRINDSDESIFTEYDLDNSKNSRDNDEMNLSKSIILAPYNSFANYDKCDDNEDIEIVDSKIVKFKSKLREYNRKYERDNNSKIDNGMYVKNNKPLDYKPKNVTKAYQIYQTKTSIFKQMEGMGFEKSFIISSLSNNKTNCATTLYHLLCEQH